jgi:hypothetical protein
MEIAQTPIRRVLSISLSFHLSIFQLKEFQKGSSYRRVGFWVSVYFDQRRLFAVSFQV